ncbi:MAG: hypothetical protein RLZZ569_1225, partial [Bacteroidota bacterium]
MKMKQLIVLLVLFIAPLAIAQPTQTVRGKVVEKETESEVIGGQVSLLLDNQTKYTAITNENGEFVITKVLVGKYVLQVLAPSYIASTQTVTVNSGTESVVEVKLLESVAEVEEVVILAQKQGEVKNEMATVSAQQFSVEETERYAGSRGDPARMASNFAGVQGADDSRNDIVVRGNSPLGIVYKVEGIDIPNPSHFAISGSTGGPVSIINNKSLSNSDFFMSAFPAEYGNSLSGVFDLKLRSGNNNRHEFTGQFGFLGTEVLAEGPLSKKSRASYLIMGRYSTLSLFQFAGIRIGTDAVPIYGDGAFKFTFPTKNGGQLSFWGLGGKSDITIKVSDKTELTEELYGEGDRDQYFGTAMFATGLTYKKSLSEKTFFTATLSASLEEQHANHDFLVRSINTTTNQINIDSIYPLMGFQFKTVKTSGYFSFNHKISKKHVIKAGLNADLLSFNMTDSVLNLGHTAFVNRWDYLGTSVLIQPFVQWKYRVNEQMDVTAGLHAQYFSMSNSLSLFEPRLGW